MSVQTPVAVLIGAGGIVVGLLLGVVIARPASQPRPAVIAEAHAVQPGPTHAAASPVAPVLTPTAAPAVAPVRAEPAQPTDADIALRISREQGEDLIGDLWRIDAAASPDLTFAALKRNASRHAGEVAVFTGEVLEIQDLPQGGSFIRLGMHYGEDVLAVFTYVEPGDDVVQGRRVRAYGTLAGTFEYTSQAGWNISVPRMNAVAVVSNNVPRRAARPPR